MNEFNVWISTKDRLPNDGETVLIWDDGIHSARFVRGLSEEDRKKMEDGELPNPTEVVWSASTGTFVSERSKLYRSCDVAFNNTVPYCWQATHACMTWCGQRVTHWMPYPEPPKFRPNEEETK